MNEDKQTLKDKVHDFHERVHEDLAAHKAALDERIDDHKQHMHEVHDTIQQKREEVHETVKEHVEDLKTKVQELGHSEPPKPAHELPVREEEPLDPEAASGYDTYHEEEATHTN